MKGWLNAQVGALLSDSHLRPRKGNSPACVSAQASGRSSCRGIYLLQPASAS